MPTVTIKRDSKLSPQETFNKVKELMENDAELKQLDSSLKCTFNDDELKGQAKGKQFTAEFSVSESGSSSEIEIVVELPFHLGLIKGVVKKTLNDRLEDALDYA